MPFKHRNPFRHKFEKVRYQINNWSSYNEALKKRGSLTLWFSDEIIGAWYSKKCKRKNRGGQFKYSDLAIQTALIIKTVYHLPYRATEGFLDSIARMMKLSIQIPHYSRMCKRAATLELSNLGNMETSDSANILIDSTGLKVFGQGQWHETKYGLKRRRQWRKLHIVIDRDTQSILAQELTTDLETDESQVQPLFENLGENINSITADAAYDSDRVYKIVTQHSCFKVQIVIPPRKVAALSASYKRSPTLRDQNILSIEKQGRYRWQKYSGYNHRALVETAMFRYKSIIGDRLYSRQLLKQKVEAKVACLIINKMTNLGMPISTKIKVAA